jgi:hypothetical protein
MVCKIITITNFSCNSDWIVGYSTSIDYRNYVVSKNGIQEGSGGEDVALASCIEASMFII